jgi:putative chitobiose transport system permease protein
MTRHQTRRPSGRTTTVSPGERRPLSLVAGMYVVAALLTALAIGPALWLIVIALQPAGTSSSSIRFTPSLANFKTVVRDGNLLLPMMNSIIVTLARAAANVLLAALAAYPLARMNFRGKNLVLLLILATMMVPEQVIVVPMFRTVVQLGLYDTLLAAIIPMAVSGFGIFMVRQAMLAVPTSLEEAARIDGAGPVRIWWHIMLPLSAPTLATLALFSVIAAWSDLLWPVIVLQSQHNYTLPVAVNELMGAFSTNLRLAYAGAVLALVPIIIAFLASQRFFKPQIFAGAVKG